MLVVIVERQNSFGVQMTQHLASLGVTWRRNTLDLLVHKSTLVNKQVFNNSPWYLQLTVLVELFLHLPNACDKSFVI